MARKQIPRAVGIYNIKGGLKTVIDRVGVLGFEDAEVSHAKFLAYKKELKGVKLVPCSGMVESMRMIKDENEIKIMRKAVSIAEAAFRKLVLTIKPGVSEDELEWNLLKFARGLGADGFSFPPIICFGKNTADVHHAKEPNRMKKGEKVLVDMGISYKGYMTDMTRVFYTAKPSKVEQKIYSIVLAANLAAIKVIKQGARLSDVDKAARDVIKKSGYGKYFGHSTGHGVGLEVHEEPRVSEKSDKIVTPGMVFTIEPGIYLNSVGGVRIEDMVYINKKGGADVMTKFFK
jgi:Xaa-Pro aminopeptidase